MNQLVGEILGPRLVADTGEWGTYAFSEMVLGTPACGSPAAPTK